MAGEASEAVAFDQIDELARWLCRLQDPGVVWAGLDEITRLHWRKEAVRRMQESLRDKAESAR